MSTAMWKLEKDLCRCCHAEGSFKHLSDPCFLLGQEEIYSVMLQDSLAVKIVPMTGPLSDATYTICESCVVRLRDASNFKRQVQDCEERFKEMYSKNLIRGFDVKEELDSDEDMKQEGIAEDDDDDDDDDDDAFMKFDDDAEADDSFDEHEEMVTVEVPKAKGKRKAKPKPKPKKATPVKKTKTKEKPIKLETEELTEAAVSGEKKKGVPSKSNPDVSRFCEVKQTKSGTKYLCTLCDQKFGIFNHWLHHYYKVHLKKKRHPCFICHQVYAPWQRMKHMEEYHGWEPPTCNACGKTFSYPHQVVDHQRQYHMGEKNHKCEHCGQAFSNRNNWKQHLSTHLEVLDYKCEYCSKGFKTAKYLRLHLKIHLDDKKYVCSVCDKPYVQLSNLKWHIKKHHPDVVDESILKVVTE